MEFKVQTKGLVIVYTGEGKGKTTAALGLVLRAVGYKKKVLIIQFGKIWFTGELEGIKNLKPYVKIVQGGKGFVKILNDKLPLQDHQKAAETTFELLATEINSGNWDLIVADEIIGTTVGGLLKWDQVLDLIKNKPEELDLVLTGRHAPQSLIDLADLATEMKALKHPFDQGFLAKVGIDY